MLPSVPSSSGSSLNVRVRLVRGPPCLRSPHHRGVPSTRSHSGASASETTILRSPHHRGVPSTPEGTLRTEPPSVPSSSGSSLNRSVRSDTPEEPSVPSSSGSSLNRGPQEPSIHAGFQGWFETRPLSGRSFGHFSSHGSSPVSVSGDIMRQFTSFETKPGFSDPPLSFHRPGFPHRIRYCGSGSGAGAPAVVPAHGRSDTASSAGSGGRGAAPTDGALNPGERTLGHTVVHPHAKIQEHVGTIAGRQSSTTSEATTHERQGSRKGVRPHPPGGQLRPGKRNREHGRGRRGSVTSAHRRYPRPSLAPLRDAHPATRSPLSHHPAFPHHKKTAAGGSSALPLSCTPDPSPW